MRREGCEPSVVHAAVHVIDKHPYPDTAIGCIQQFLSEEFPAEIGIPDERLYVKAAHGQSGAPRANDECFGTVSEKPESGVAGMLSLADASHLIQRRQLARGNRSLGG